MSGYSEHQHLVHYTLIHLFVQQVSRHEVRDVQPWFLPSMRYCFCSQKLCVATLHFTHALSWKYAHQNNAGVLLE